MSNVNERDMFAVDHGDYAGSYFVVCLTGADNIGCVQLPDMQTIDVPTVEFTRGLKNNVLTWVALLPKDVYNYCKQVYNYEQDDNI